MCCPRNPAPPVTRTTSPSVSGWPSLTFGWAGDWPSPSDMMVLSPVALCAFLDKTLQKKNHVCVWSLPGHFHWRARKHVGSFGQGFHTSWFELRGYRLHCQKMSLLALLFSTMKPHSFCVSNPVGSLLDCSQLFVYIFFYAHCLSVSVCDLLFGFRFKPFGLCSSCLCSLLAKKDPSLQGIQIQTARCITDGYLLRCLCSLSQILGPVLWGQWPRNWSTSTDALFTGFCSPVQMSWWCLSCSSRFWTVMKKLKFKYTKAGRCRLLVCQSHLFKKHREPPVKVTARIVRTPTIDTQNIPPWLTHGQHGGKYISWLLYRWVPVNPNVLFANFWFTGKKITGLVFPSFLC